MDDGDLGADLPQEDIYALGALSPYSYYHGWCFPQNMERYNNYIDFTGASPGPSKIGNKPTCSF